MARKGLSGCQSAASPPLQETPSVNRAQFKNKEVQPWCGWDRVHGFSTCGVKGTAVGGTLVPPPSVDGTMGSRMPAKPVANPCEKSHTKGSCPKP